MNSVPKPDYCERRQLKTFLGVMKQGVRMPEVYEEDGIDVLLQKLENERVPDDPEILLEDFPGIQTCFVQIRDHLRFALISYCDDHGMTPLELSTSHQYSRPRMNPVFDFYRWSKYKKPRGFITFLRGVGVWMELAPCLKDMNSESLVLVLNVIKSIAGYIPQDDDYFLSDQVIAYDMAFFASQLGIHVNDFTTKMTSNKVKCLNGKSRNFRSYLDTLYKYRSKGSKSKTEVLDECKLIYNRMIQEQVA